MGSSQPGWRSAQFARGFEVGDLAAPAADGLFLSGGGHDYQVDVAVAADGVAVGDVTGQENEPAVVQLERVRAGAEGERSLEAV